ncbi:MAG TPA: hypothetical protein VFG34_11010 [Sphingopyxis sp.]|nr:hypothetical protein [Sphingopyxis sp.]
MMDMVSMILPEVTQMLLVLGAVAIICLAALAGWRDWISLKKDQLNTSLAMGKTASGSPSGRASEDMKQQGAASSSARIEMADLRERLRKLEAIAEGVDL